MGVTYAISLERLIARRCGRQRPSRRYGIAQHSRRLSKELLQVEEGSLNPALQHMELKRLVSAEWKLTPTKRRVHYYELTAARSSLSAPSDLSAA